MGIGLLVVWVCLIVYVIVLFKAKIIDKKERKWMFMMVGLVAILSILAGFHVSFNFVISFLNNTFGKLSRMVVNI